MLRQLAAVFCLRAHGGGPPTLKAYWHIYYRQLHHWPSLSQAMTEDMLISVTDDASYGILERGKELNEIKTSSLISTVRKQKCLTLVQAGTCMLHGFFFFFFFVQVYKLLMQNFITVHNLHPSNTCSTHVSYSLFFSDTRHSRNKYLFLHIQHM